MVSHLHVSITPTLQATYEFGHDAPNVRCDEKLYHNGHRSVLLRGLTGLGMAWLGVTWRRGESGGRPEVRSRPQAVTPTAQAHSYLLPYPGILWDSYSAYTWAATEYFPAALFFSSIDSSYNVSIQVTLPRCRRRHRRWWNWYAIPYICGDNI